MGTLAIPFYVTPRERQVTELILSGASDREIAKTLCMAEGNVKHRCSQIYLKAGIKQESKRARLARMLLPEKRATGAVVRFTPCELTTAKLLGDGLSNTVIAERVNISLHTLKHRNQVIFDKSGVWDRTQFVIWWASHSWMYQ